MGTLQDQPVRNRHSISYHDIKARAEQVRDIAHELGISHQAASTTFLAMTINRFTSAYISNGDIHDEQMAGIGEHLSNISWAIEHIFYEIRASKVEDAE